MTLLLLKIIINLNMIKHIATEKKQRTNINPTAFILIHAILTQLYFPYRLF